MAVPSPVRPSVEKRSLFRRRTRLRPIKLVTREKRFIEDGSAIDLSEDGVRVRRFGNALVPPTLLYFDESEETLRPAAVVWRVRNEVGLRFTGKAYPIDATDRAHLAGRYYAAL
ncbi:hypothetical protein FP2506_18659 [Fulvimarina pelagi HTCC2506]|uniref:PilZ domain-containing protein n=1 Tax=Fulvimarina pelagi HTCC2506 TaxID=314231 RepID=Q0G0Q1_9HYPH|nr:hypothetical protein [Fulvimarina pelagi]EAU40938.1 hypothetical protein FP2506_18659 [Fulvimarina pelagi HTCC2506]